MVTYCSLTNEKSLTKILIDNCLNNNQLYQCFHNFVNKVEWADGLDHWTIKENVKKSNLDFDSSLGLYFPRQNLLKRALTDTDLFNSNKTNQHLIEQFEQINDKKSETNQTKTSLQKQNSNETNSTKIRYPLRHVESNYCLKEDRIKTTNQTINRENLHKLLKQELNYLFNRETTNVNRKKTLFRIPSVEIKHQNKFQKKSSKTQQRNFSSSPTLNSNNPNQKLWDTRQSPYVFQPISTLSLTVTPLEIYSPKQTTTNNSSQENLIQQDISHRSSTQPVLYPCSTHSNDDQQKFHSKCNNETSSTAPFLILSKNSNDDQTQTIKKNYRLKRYSAKMNLQRTKTIHLLPHIDGKRIHVTFANQK